MKLVKKEIAELIKVFQYAILEVTAKLTAGQEVISAEDLKDANYVVGMAAITSANLELLLSQDQDYYVENKSSVFQFLTSTRQFAGKLHAEGYGFSV